MTFKMCFNLWLSSVGKPTDWCIIDLIISKQQLLVPVLWTVPKLLHSVVDTWGNSWMSV